MTTDEMTTDDPIEDQPSTKPKKAKAAAAKAKTTKARAATVKSRKAEPLHAPSGVGVADIDWSQGAYIAGSGACMGTADVVPGVSGGTMAVALGIYSRLLAAIASINMHSIRALLKFDIKRVLEIVHWRFLCCLGLGIMSGVVVMLKIVKLPHLIQTQPTRVYAVFFGLVLASALVLGRRLPSWGVVRVAMLAVGAAAGFAVVNLVPVDTPESPLFIFACGVTAICAMLLPGISGSFILLILGKYEYVLNSLSQLLHADLSQLKIVLPFVLGCAVGIAAFSRVLGWLLHKYEHTVVAFLVGLLIGTLWRIWPYQHLTKIVVREKERVIGAQPFWPVSWDVSVALLMMAGFAAVLLIEYVAARRAKAVSPA